MDRDEAKRILGPDIYAALEKARQNAHTLSHCPKPRHLFLTTDHTQRRYVCSYCKGEVDRHAYEWYRLGLLHATRKED